MVARMKIAGEGNPGRTITDNEAQRKYPTTYKGFAIWRDPSFAHMLRVTKPDGTDFGLYSDERTYTKAIDVHVNEESLMSVSHMTRAEFEKNASQ